MNSLLRIFRTLGKGISEFFSSPRNFALLLLGAAFLYSFASWALNDRLDEVVIYFPALSGDSLQGELRSIPRSRDAESFAEYLVSESLLGPRSPGLVSGFGSGARLESVLYRNGKLYINISEEAALGDAELLKKSLKALERTARAGISSVGLVVIAIGGYEPYAESFGTDSSSSYKIEKKN